MPLYFSYIDTELISAFVFLIYRHRADQCLCILIYRHRADPRLCFCYTDRTISLLSKSEILSLVAVQPGLCLTWSEALKTGFIVRQLM